MIPPPPILPVNCTLSLYHIKVFTGVAFLFIEELAIPLIKCTPDSRPPCVYGLLIVIMTLTLVYLGVRQFYRILLNHMAVLPIPVAARSKA